MLRPAPCCCVSRVRLSNPRCWNGQIAPAAPSARCPKSGCQWWQHLLPEGKRKFGLDAFRSGSWVASEPGFGAGCEVQICAIWVASSIAKEVSAKGLVPPRMTVGYHSSITQSLIRGGTPTVIVGVLLIAAAVASVAISWHRSDPATKAGRLRRSLDAVGKETERRDREIEELTGTPVEE